MRSSITAFGTPLALALILSATSAPAFAEFPQVEKAGPPMSILEAEPKVQPKTPPRKPTGNTGGPAEMSFQPDLRVTSLNGSGNGGSSRNYHFRVENVGLQTANTIALSTVLTLRHDTDPSNIRQKTLVGTYPSLAMGESQAFTAICIADYQYHCDGAYMTAAVPNDLHPADNSAAD